MLLKGVEIPTALLRAPERRQLVVFAGAGVSKPAPSNYPDFKELALELGQGTGVAWDNVEPLDGYLGRLNSAQVAVHSLTAERLTDPASRPSAIHHTLVQLFPSQEAVRIVTTNFDEHFTTALAERFGTQVSQYQAPAFPVGSRFSGIVYLHGFVRGPHHDLVLTDADFGRAYLTEGWARRFLVDLLTDATLVVLFIGYSADDPPFRYIARALPVQGTERRYALTTADKASRWVPLGITGVDPVP